MSGATAAAAAPPEPVAVIGIGALYPGAESAQAYWELLRRPGAAPRQGGGLTGDVDVARFGVPPAQARSLARMQVLMLQAAEQCLADAGYGQRPLQTDRTDVVVGSCFGLDRQHANALRVAGSRYARDLELAVERRGVPAPGLAEDLRARLQQRVGASAHDRVGEMASTIPARVANAFGLRGRALAVESADATSFVALASAVLGLRAASCDAALVLVGQRDEGPVVARGLAGKGLLDPVGHPFAVDGSGLVLGEGVGALLLKRLSSALADGDRIYARVLDCSLRHDPRPGTFRYSLSAQRRRDLAASSFAAAGVSPDSVGYVECAGSGVARETEAELDALGAVFAGRAPGGVALGSVGDRLGHTFAAAGLAGVTKAVLALHHRAIPPQTPPPGGAEWDLGETPFRFVRDAEHWRPPVSGAARCAAVVGSSMTGTLGHVLLQEHRPGQRPDAPRGAGWRPRARSAPEPVAVVSLGGRFSGAPDAAAFRRVTSSGRDRLAPVPESVLERELYYAPGALSLSHSYAEHGGHVPVPDWPPDGLRVPPQRYERLDAAQRTALAVAGELLGELGRGVAALRGPGLVAVGSTLGLTRERELAAALRLGEVEALARELPALAGLPERDREALLDALRAVHGAREAPSPGQLDGCLASGIAALIANEYGLDAVPVAVEAACASSLAAVDLAVTALRAGRVDFAVAGGVELACTARDMVLCSSLGLLSREKITPFDTAADGFTPGDGCALFLLRRYADARRDGDRVIGVIRGVGACNDARSLVAPDVNGQARALREAFAQVEFEPAAVDYLEAHGTGTRVGDAVEIAAAASVYGEGRRPSPLWIGSAKSFFGHTFAAAGGAGLLRALQALESGVVPPNANLSVLNPELGLSAIPAQVPVRELPWPAPQGRPRRAGVSSFGTGGINYHLLLEEHREAAP